MTLARIVVLSAVLGGPLAGASPSPAAAPDAVEAARLAVRTKQFARALELLRAPAHRETAEARYLLGLASWSGMGQPPDQAAARENLQFAAEHGHRAAAYALAALLAEGSEHERREAVVWRDRALKAGYAPALDPKHPDGLPYADARVSELPEDLRYQIARFAARQDDVDLLAAVHSPGLLTRRDDFGRGLLAEAAGAGARRVSIALLESGAAADTADEAGITPLMLAAASPQVEVSRRLLAAGARADTADRLGRTALMRAAAADRTEQIAVLLSAGASLTQVDSQGYTATDIALLSRADRASAALRAAGGVVARAAPARSVRGIDVTRVGLLHQGWPPLLVAVARDDATEVRRRVAAGERVDAMTPQGAGALQVAIDSRASAAAAALLDLGADPGIPDRDGLSARHRALRSGHEDLIAVFFPSNVALPAAEAPALLGLAIDRGDLAAVRALLARGADARVADRQGLMPLHRAARRGHAALVKLLTDRGADVAARDSRGRTALWHAVAMRSTEALDVLLAVRSPVDVADREGITPLTLAARAGDRAIVQRLLASEVAREAPLRAAAALGHEAVVELLLMRPLSVDAADPFGDTALMMAARAGHASVCARLMAAGANTRLRNRDRASSADIAESRGFHELAAKLRS